MRGKKKVDAAVAALPAEPKAQKKPGRKPMTEAEKAAAAKKRAEEKALAENMKPTLVLQYQGSEIDTAQIVEAAKADFKAKKKRTAITSLAIYLKPEEQTAYYVVNGEFDGKVTY